MLLSLVEHFTVMAIEQIQLGYSSKNIPTSNKWEYTKSGQENQKFLRNMTWSATFFLSKAQPNRKETFGFKTTMEPKRLPEMRQFEDKMLDLVQNVQFRDKNHKNSEFQQKI